MLKSKIMKTIIQSVKGTRDFYPEDMAVRIWLYENMRQVSEAFGYQEYDGPFLETLELYAAKSGEELVKEQSFVFPDRGGDLITLRPELTPSLTRMVAARQGQLVYPLRWWSFGPFWRYERPQKGRSREFFQWNVDLIGLGTAEADAEVTAVIATFFRRVGLTPEHVAILVNNRRLMEAELHRLEISPDLQGDVFRLIDRRGKMQPAEWDAYAQELGLSPRQLEELKALLANPNLWENSDELQGFFAALDAMGVSEYVRYDANTIRGLDYYTGTVLEAHDLTGKVRRSILGGGRYDNLLADVGGERLPGVGFAMGDTVITLVLEAAGLLPEDAADTPAPIMVTLFDEGHLLDTFTLATELRQTGLKVTTYLQSDKLGKQFRHADRIGTRLVVVLGPDEISREVITVKNLRTGEQQEIPRNQAGAAIKQNLLEFGISS
jgi:histidyl-tRNA synthetase